jgi:hypothetical protein
MILGQLSPVQSLTNDATATLSVPAVDFSGVFWFQTDATDFVNETATTDLRFYCDSNNLAQVNFGNAVVPAAEIVSIGSVSTDKTIKQDIANWCTRLVLGTGGADLLDNEEELVADILTKDAELFSSMKALLDLHGGTSAAPRNNNSDASPVDSITVDHNNYARQVLLSGLASNASEMVDRINAEIAERGSDTRVVADFMPINPTAGDTLVLYAVYGSNNQLHIGSAAGAVVSPALETNYLGILQSNNVTLFSNGNAPHAKYADGIASSAKAWHVYKVLITFT